MDETIFSKEINDHLKAYGYNLAYSFNDNYCGEALLKHLGKSGYKKFWKQVGQYELQNGEHKVEKYIRTLVGNDIKHLKILLSGQIAISVAILDLVIKEINNDFINNQELRILELGGYDGWASDYLNKKIQSLSKIDVIDLDCNFEQKNKNVRLIQKSYDEYKSIDKYDIVFSIMGAPAEEVNDLINCLISNIKDNGRAYIGIRVQPSDYKAFVKLFSDFKLFQTTEKISTVKVPMDLGIQTLPVFSLLYKNIS